MSALIRQLSPPETAYTFCNRKIALSAVVIVHLKAQFSFLYLQEKLTQLQQRHKLLQASITKDKGRYFFKQMSPVKSIPCGLVERNTENTWEEVVTFALNTRYDDSGPLMKCYWVKGEGIGELVLVFHHALIDGQSARLILVDVMKLLGGRVLPVISSPTIVHRYPRKLYGLSGVFRKSKFLLGEVFRSVAFALHAKPIPIPAHSLNGIKHFTLGKEVSQGIFQKAGTLGLSINSLIGAALVIALSSLYPEKKRRRVRAVFFADMRSNMNPPVSSMGLGCYISMLQLGLQLTEEDDIISIAKQIWKRTFVTAKRKDTYLFSMMSPHAIRALFALKSFRLAETALSYIGEVPLVETYGDIEVKGLNAFITNNKFGPLLSAASLYVFGKLSVHINYLSAETSPAQAQQLADIIQGLLEEIA